MDGLEHQQESYNSRANPCPPLSGTKNARKAIICRHSLYHKACLKGYNVLCDETKCKSYRLAMVVPKECNTGM